MFAYSRLPKDFRHLPSLDRLEMFLKVIKAKIKAKKWNSIYFDKPGSIAGKG